jgi:hypothetical protein
VFGKVYRLGFLKKHNIQFSELRSNEDLEFNTKVVYPISSNIKSDWRCGTVDDQVVIDPL